MRFYIYVKLPLFIITIWALFYGSAKDMDFVPGQDLQGYKIRSYNFLRVLGEGSFAKVYEAYDEESGNTVAIKSMSMAHFKNKKVKELAQSQIKIMKACRDNPNIIRFIDNFKTEFSLLIVMEYCEDGTLDQYLEKMKRLTEAKATYFLKHLINGFRGLHQKNVIHRDFKAANVLLHGGQAKIADLGFAKMLDSPQGVAGTFLGTSLTMAPEVHEGKSYGLKADIWSLGIVYYQMIYGKYPYLGKDDFQIYTESKNKPRFSGVNISAEARDFILKCLTFNQEYRIGWAEVYRHPLITGEQRVSFGLATKLEAKDISFYDEKQEKKPKASPIINESLQFEKQKMEKLEVIKLQKMRVKNQKKKKMEAALQKYKQLYFNKRNNSIFVFRYIVPYVHMLNKLPIKHANYLYLLCKKTYHQLKTFLQEIVLKNLDFFKVKEHFQEFTKADIYKELKEMLELDLMIAQVQAKQYKSSVTQADQDLQMEFAFDKIANKNWKAYIQQIVQEYQFVLMSQIGNVKDKEVKEKTVLIIEALSYLKNHNEEDNFEVFDRSIEHLNYEDAELSINHRLEYLLEQFK